MKVNKLQSCADKTKASKKHKEVVYEYAQSEKTKKNTLSVSAQASPRKTRPSLSRLAKA